MGDYAKAETLLKRALAIREKVTDPTAELYLIQSLKSLASLYETKGEYVKAGLLLEQVVTRLAKIFGAENPIMSGALNDLAIHHKTQGDYVKAEQLLSKGDSAFGESGRPG